MPKQTDIFTNVDYFLISKNKQPVYTFTGDEINGKTKTELQYYLGELYGNELFNYSLKRKDNAKNESGFIRSIVPGRNDTMNKMKKEIPASNNDNFDIIRKLIAEKFELEIEHLKEKIKEKDSLILAITKEKNEVEKEYNTLVDKIEKESGGMNGTLLNLITKFLPKDILDSSKMGLSDNTNKEITIPAELLNVLNRVDYTKLTKDQIKQYADLLASFINNLPMKG